MTIRQTLRRIGNDYSSLEPFDNNQPIKTSIIVPTYKHEDLLAKTLTNFSHQQDLRQYSNWFEVIVVDDGSPGDVASVVKSIPLPCGLRYLPLPDNQGCGLARNAGTRVAEGDLLIFIDSDIFLPQEYFQEHWRIHNASKNVLVAGLGEMINPDDPRIPLLCQGIDVRPDIRKDFRFKADVSSYRFLEDRKGVKFERHIYHIIDETNAFKDLGFHKSIWLWTLPMLMLGHTFSVRKELTLKVGGSDPRFGRYPCEDYHFAAKVIAAGCFLIPLLATGVFRMRHSTRADYTSENEQENHWFNNLDLFEQLLDEDLPSPPMQ